jgi:hypothetical protein
MGLWPFSRGRRESGEMDNDKNTLPPGVHVEVGAVAPDAEDGEGGADDLHRGMKPRQLSACKMASHAFSLLASRAIYKDVLVSPNPLLY